MKKEKLRYETVLRTILVIFMLVGLFALFISIKSIFFNTQSHNDLDTKKESHLKFTSFDKDLARKLMDKNNDGKCDVCGMDVNMCIDTGQMECTMTGKDGIGLLDSSHIHADWKIYINNKPLDLSDGAHMERIVSNKSVSSFIHVDSGSPPPEKTGDIIHMHAKNVPLWIFFESLGMKITDRCLILDSGGKYCNGEKNKLRMFINGIENKEFGNYIFKDLDKILITYGDDNEEAIKKQISSITDFAESH